MRYVILGVRARYYSDSLVKKHDFISGEWSFGSLEFVRSKDLKALLTKRYGKEPFKFAILNVKSELCPVIPLDGLDNLSPKVRSWVMLSWMKSKVLPKLNTAVAYDFITKNEHGAKMFKFLSSVGNIFQMRHMSIPMPTNALHSYTFELLEVVDYYPEYSRLENWYPSAPQHLEPVVKQIGTGRYDEIHNAKVLNEIMENEVSIIEI